MALAQEDLGRPVPAGRHVGGVSGLVSHVAGQTVVGNFHDVIVAVVAVQKPFFAVIVVGGRDEDVFRFYVAMEEVMSVDVADSGQDLRQDGFERGQRERAPLALPHELVEVLVHALHDDVELVVEIVDKQFPDPHEVFVGGHGEDELDFADARVVAQLREPRHHGLDGEQAALAVVEVFLFWMRHGRVLHESVVVGWAVRVGAAGVELGQGHGAEAAIAELLQKRVAVRDGLDRDVEWGGVDVGWDCWLRGFVFALEQVHHGAECTSMETGGRS